MGHHVGQMELVRVVPADHSVPPATLSRQLLTADVAFSPSGGRPEDGLPDRLTVYYTSDGTLRLPGRSGAQLHLPQRCRDVGHRPRSYLRLA